MSVAIDQVTNQREHGPMHAMFISQPFWVTVALVVICFVMGQISNVFFTEDNFFNVTRNYAFIGIIALGMTAVIITRGIDLSVGPSSGCRAW
jgi:ribose transport system permease protein